MGILEGQPRPRDRGGRCRVAVVLSKLDNDDCDTLLGWVQDYEMEATAVAVHLEQFGIDLSDQSIQRHRRRECKCHVRHPDWACHG